jgi:hypothetical protein
MARKESVVSRFIPVPDAWDEQEIEIAAPAELVFDSAKCADLFSHPLVAAIFRVRAFLMGDRPRRRHVVGLVAETLSLGWGVLLFDPGRTLVMGAVSRPWVKDVTFSAAEPGEFADFAEPDLVKIAWSLEVRPLGKARTRFRTETRVAATDREARRKFLRYWRVFAPGIRLIRWMMLRSVKRDAERRHRESSPVAGQAA